MNKINEIELLFNEDNSEKKVLQYVREPKLTMQLFRDYGDLIAKKYLKVKSYDRISEIDRSVTYFIDLNQFSYYNYSFADFEAFEKIIDLEEIIKFDRVFRYEIPYFQAMEMIYSCTKFFLEFFKNNKYDILLTHMVDEFVVDIMVRVAKYYNVKVISYCANSYDPRYIHITERGEYLKVRNPSNEEIDAFLGFLKDKTSKPFARPANVVYKRIATYYFIYKIKYIYHYLLLYRLLDRKSYRNMMTTSETYPRNLRDILGASKYLYKSINSLPKPLVKQKTVYIPLHYHPEASTDYWIKDPNYLTYYPSLLKTIQYYSENGYQVLVKEHSASYMQRDLDLYKALVQIPNTYLLNPFITTYEVLEHVDYVVVWTGTTGVEALMQNKKVILAAGETYYSFGKLASIGQEKTATVPTENDKRFVATSILSSFLPIS